MGCKHIQSLIKSFKIIFVFKYLATIFSLAISSPAAGRAAEATAGTSASTAGGRNSIRVGSSAGGAGAGGGGGGARDSTKEWLTGASEGIRANSTQ